MKHLTALVLVIAVGNVVQAQEKAKAMPNYMPLAVGNQWHYKLNVNNKIIDATMRVEKLDVVNGVTLARVSTVLKGKAVSTEQYGQTAEGLFRFSLNGQDVTPPLCLLKYPLKGNAKWEGGFKTGGEEATYTSEAETEKVEVAGGKFTTQRVKMLGKSGKSEFESTYWFAENVGIVKQNTALPGVSLELELVKFEPAKGGERGDKGDKKMSLFNGKDLDGWDTWLGNPHKSKEAVGLNKDPNKVYTVVDVDGKPAIRISGETFGAITSKNEYENYHLTLEFKWGEKRWPPREKAVRDSGLLYHCVGPHGALGSFWMKSQECQIQEKDCGDYWSVAGAIVDVEGERKGKGAIVYKKGGDKFTVPGKDTGSRIVKSPDNENPTGEWNTIELLTVGPTSVHVVNGKVVMVLTNSRHKVDGKEEPLTRGKLQLQSEGAEVYYRNITLTPITKIPEKYLQ